jgi:hypothetical protein
MKKLLFVLTLALSTASFAEMMPNTSNYSESLASMYRLRGQCGASDKICQDICSRSIASVTEMNPASVDGAVVEAYWRACSDATLRNY